MGEFSAMTIITYIYGAIAGPLGASLRATSMRPRE
jgi:hypothetical protein